MIKQVKQVLLYARLAQSVEPSAYIRKVGGSSPSAGTYSHSTMVMQLTLNQWIAGSSPVASTFQEDYIMVENYKVITLCGSTRFKDEFERANRELTLNGNIVISVGCFGHSGDSFTERQKVMLDDIHKRKIDMADAIYVINKDGYIGASTKSEIEYAKAHEKEIIYMYAPVANR